MTMTPPQTVEAPPDDMSLGGGPYATVHRYDGTDVEPYRCSCGHVPDGPGSGFTQLLAHLGIADGTDAAAELAKATVPHVLVAQRRSESSVSDEDFAAFAEGAGFDPDPIDVSPTEQIVGYLAETKAAAQPALPGVEFTATGASIVGPVDADAVIERLRILATTETWSRWVAGDLFQALADDYEQTHPDEPTGAGEAAAYRLVAGLGFSQSWLNGAIAVAERVPAANRREGLSWGHHREVAREAIAVDEQSKWLGHAIANRWNVAQLRDAIDEHLTADQGDLGIEDPWKPPKPPVAALKEILAVDEDAWVAWHPKSGALRLYQPGGS